MQGPTYLFFITQTSTGRSYYDNNGVISLSTVPKPLLFAPDGWKGIGVQNNRSSKYFGLDRSLSVPLAFVEDGAAILRYLWLTFGTKADASLVILEQKLFFDDTHFGFYYTNFYKAPIDFTNNFNIQGPKVTCNTIEGGLPKLIKSRETTTYEIPATTPGWRVVLMDGLKLLQKAKYIVSNGPAVDNASLTGIHIIDLPFFAGDALTSIGAVSQGRVKLPGNLPTQLWNTNSFFLQTGSQEVNMTLKWDFKVFVDLAPGTTPVSGQSIFLQLHILKAADNRLLNVNIDRKGGGDHLLLYGQTHHFQGEYNVTVPAGCRCVLFMSSGPGGNGAFTYFSYDLEGSSFDIDYSYTHSESFVQAIEPEPVFKFLINAITEGKYQGESAFLREWANLPLTCGDWLRGITATNLKTSLSDFFDAFNVFFDIGIGIKNNKAVLDLKVNMIDYDDFINLGEVKNLKTSNASEFIFSTIKIGYKEQNYDNVNGRYEVNNLHEYLTPHDQVNKTLDFTCPYRADPYGAEFIRINLEGKTTTDNKGDSEVFVLHTQKHYSGFALRYYKLDRSLNALASGILDPASIFNLFLSPKHCLYRKGSYIRSLFFRMDAEKLKFQTTQKNADMVVGNVVEKSDVVIGSLAAKYFEPVLAEFEVPDPVNLIQILDQNALKTFRFFKLGFPFKGIPMRVNVIPETREVQTMQVLISPDTDLMPLQYIKV